MIVLGLTVAGGVWHLRVHLRDHLAQRDGDILTTVALARQYANGSGALLAQRLGDPVEQLALALEISQIREGVLGVRLFDARGLFETAVPPELLATNLSPDDLPELRQLQPVSRFLRQADLGKYFLTAQADPAENQRSPLLEVTIPLHARGETNLIAAAQLLLDGRSIAEEYARIDGHLWLLGLGLYVGGALLLSGVLGWAYRRLRQAHALVEDRTARLLRANHELSLAAKTSALGAVSAHLIHGLSNPLANLQDFMASHGSAGQDGEFKNLEASTRRMQQLVHDVVRVLGEEQAGDHYEITVAETVDVLNGKLAPAVATSGANLLTVLDAAGTLSNRHANLVLLILENLVHNALRATPAQGTVCVRFCRERGGLRCEVADQGTGLAESVRPRLFAPCRSTRGGSGLGLAISKQLANHLGAELELQSSSAAGCVFVLWLPPNLLLNLPSNPPAESVAANAC